MTNYGIWKFYIYIYIELLQVIIHNKNKPVEQKKKKYGYEGLGIHPVNSIKFTHLMVLIQGVLIARNNADICE